MNYFKKHRSFGKLWAEVYDHLVWFATLGLEQTLRKNFLEFINIANPLKILDLCCGTGSLSVLLAKKYPDAEIIGLDLSSAMIEKAKNKLRKIKTQKSKIKFIVDNAASPNLESEAFDLITISFGLHEMDFQTMENTLKSSVKLLKESGTLALVDYKKPSQKLSGKIRRLLLKLLEPQAENTVFKINWVEFLTSLGFSQVSTKTIFRDAVMFIRAVKA